MGHKHDMHECRCGHQHCACGHHPEHQAGGSGKGAGFALGVAIGAAAAALSAPDSGKKTRDKAKAKLDELTGGKTPEELLDAVKEVAGRVVGDIQNAANEGKKEAKKTKQDVLTPKKKKK